MRKVEKRTRMTGSEPEYSTMTRDGRDKHVTQSAPNVLPAE